MPDSRFHDGLLRVGAAQLLAGLVGGMFIMGMKNPQLGLTAHLTGIGAGIMLMVFAVVWPRLALPRLISRAAAWMSALALPGVWISLTIGAVVGTGKATPLGGAGRDAGPLWEGVVGFGLVSTSLILLVAVLAIFVGLMRPQPR